MPKPYTSNALHLYWFKNTNKNLERRLKLWSQGQLDSRLHEGRTIQRQQLRNQPPSAGPGGDRTATLFAKLMSEGKVRGAMRLITHTDSTGPITLGKAANLNDPNSSKTVRDVLV